MTCTDGCDRSRAHSGPAAWPPMAWTRITSEVLNGSLNETAHAVEGGESRRGLLPRERFRCVLGMLSSLEVKVLRPT